MFKLGLTKNNPLEVWDVKFLGLSDSAPLSDLSSLAARTVVSRTRSLDDASNGRFTVEAGLALALIDPPKPFCRTKVASYSVRQVYFQRRAAINCFVQHLANGIVQPADALF